MYLLYEVINGDMPALCFSLLLLAALMHLGRAWSTRRRRMAAVFTKSKMPPRGSPSPRRRQTPAVSPVAFSTKSKAAPRLEEVAEPESAMIAKSSTPKVYPWSPVAEHAAAAEEAGRKSRREDDALLPPCYQIPPCLEGCTHRWVKEPLPHLLAAKQVRA